MSNKNLLPADNGLRCPWTI